MRDIWNPWHGCIKISEGCQNCYMYYLDETKGKIGSDIYRVKNNFDYPLKKNKHGIYKIKSGEILRVCMTSDFFLEEADEWRNEVWDIIKNRKDVMFFILTKRADRIKECLPSDWNSGWNNVWINVTAENQKRANERIPILLEIPAKYKGILAAPLLETLDINEFLKTGQIDMVSIGGENYSGARICNYNWVNNIYKQCVQNNVNCNFFETGTRFVKDNKLYEIPRKQQQLQAIKSGLIYKGRDMTFEYIPKEKEDIQIDLFNIIEPQKKRVNLVDIFIDEEKVNYCIKCTSSNCNKCSYIKSSFSLI